jgi:acyl-CoA thioesterase I
MKRSFGQTSIVEIKRTSGVGRPTLNFEVECSSLNVERVLPKKRAHFCRLMLAGFRLRFWRDAKINQPEAGSTQRKARTNASGGTGFSPVTAGVPSDASLHAVECFRPVAIGLTVLALFCLLCVLNGAAYADEQTPQRPAILVLGDSLSAGYGVDPDQAYPALLQKKIDSAELNFTLINAGLSGDTTAGGLRRLNWLLRRRIDVLILELGGNDGLRGVPVAATRSNLQVMIDNARQANPQVKIVLAGMQMPPNLGQDYVHAFSRIFPELAEKNHATLIPFLLEGVGGNPSLNQADGIHPTAEGHKIVCENVWKVLKPILENIADKGR